MTAKSPFHPEKPGIIKKVSLTIIILLSSLFLITFWSGSAKAVTYDAAMEIMEARKTALLEEKRITGVTAKSTNTLTP